MSIFIADIVYIQPRPRVSLSWSLSYADNVMVSVDSIQHLEPALSIGHADSVTLAPTIVNQISPSLSISHSDNVDIDVTVNAAGTLVLNIANVDKFLCTPTITGGIDDLLMFQIFDLDPMQASNPLYAETFI